MGQVTDTNARQQDLARTLIDRGHGRTYISDRMGYPPAQLDRLVARAPVQPQGSLVTQMETALARLAPHARARNITPMQLAMRLLGTVAESELVDAILDDGGR